MLAHLYAAEALIQLSRISEAIDHLDPSNIQVLKHFNNLNFHQIHYKGLSIIT
jgi:hypothetical protein